MGERTNGIHYFKSDLIRREKSKAGIYVLFRSLSFKKAFFEYYTQNGAPTFKECLWLLQHHFKPKHNKQALYKQVIKDLRKGYCLQVTNPKLKLLVKWNGSMNKISIKISKF